MANLILGSAFWILTLYLIRSELRLENVTRSISRVPVTPHVPWWSRFLYMGMGAFVASAVWAVVTLSAGMEPFSSIIQATSVPTTVETQLVVVTSTPTPFPSQTPTLVLTATPGITPIYAVTPLPQSTPKSTEGGDDGTPGWMKTPNGQGGGQFITPPGQGGVPPGQGGTSPSQGQGGGHTPGPPEPKATKSK